MSHFKRLEDDFVYLETKGHKIDKLHRIVATEHFEVGDGFLVQKGSYGGYISDDTELSGNGGYKQPGVWTKSWVADGAFVVGHSFIQNGALVAHGSLIVNAVLSGNIIVKESEIITTVRNSLSNWRFNGASIIQQANKTSAIKITNSVIKDQSIFGNEIDIKSARITEPGQFILIQDAGSFSGDFYVYRDQDGHDHYCRGCFKGDADMFIIRSKNVHTGKPSIQDEYKHLIEYAKIRLERGYEDVEPEDSHVNYVVRHNDKIWITNQYINNERKRVYHFRRRLPLASSEFQSLTYLPEMRQLKIEQDS